MTELRAGPWHGYVAIFAEMAGDVADSVEASVDYHHDRKFFGF